MKITIKITKDILKKSMMCGVKSRNNVARNCAIALAVREPEFSFDVDFPDALIEKIGIAQVNEILSKSESLSFASKA